MVKILSPSLHSKHFHGAKSEEWGFPRFTSTKTWGKGKNKKVGGKEGNLSPFSLPHTSFFALSAYFARPKLVCSPISMDSWVFCSRKMHRNACYAGSLSPTLIFLYVIIYILVHLFNISEQHLLDVHCYADNSQLYLSFRPADGLSS